MAIVVGSFVKTGTTGANTTQSFAHGLGSTPKAMIFYTTDSAGGFRTGLFPSIGFVDQDRSAIAFGMAAGHNLASSNTVSRVAAKAITIVRDDAAVFAECDITSWDSVNVNLTWTTQITTDTPIIGFIAIGGGNVQSKVIDHRTAASGGIDAVTGVGFTPTLALMAHGGGDLTGNAPASASGVGTTVNLSLAATDGTNQWSLLAGSDDADGAGDSRRGQRTDQLFQSLTTTEASYEDLGAITSMDADGLTITYSNSPTANTHQGFLFLRNVSFAIGSFNKSADAAPVAQNVSTPGLNAQAVLLASFQNIASTSILTQGRMGIGFSDGTREVSGAMTDEDTSDPTDVSAYMSATKGFTKVDNDTDTIDAEADITLSPGQFTVTWSTNDAVATQILYLAMATASGGGGQGGQGGKGGNGGGGGGGNPGGGPPGQGGGNGKPDRFFVASRRKRRLADF